MKTLASVLALTAAAALAAPSADAASSVQNFDLRGNAGLAKSHTYVYDDVTITAHAKATKNGQVSGAHVGQFRHGLGVTNSVKTVTNNLGQTRLFSTSDDGASLDGRGHDEAAWLSFSSPFKITAAVFSHVSNVYQENVQVLDAYGNSLGVFNLTQNANQHGIAHIDLSSLDYTGTTIGFAALGNNDSFKVRSIKGYAAAVPTPSAAAAGLLGLAALSARRRRRTEDASA